MDLTKLHLHWRVGKNGNKEYKSFSLARSYRQDGKNRNAIVLKLGKLSDEEIKAGLRKGIAERSIYPLVCGSALGNIGITSLLDLMATYLPSPSDFVQVQGKVPGTEKEKVKKISPEESLCAFAFKTVSEPHVGELTFLKVKSYCAFIL